MAKFNCFALLSDIEKLKFELFPFTILYKLFNFVYFVNSSKLFNSIVTNHLQEVDYNFKFYIEPKGFKNIEFSTIDAYDYTKSMHFQNKIASNENENPNLFNYEISPTTLKLVKEYKIFSIEFHRIETPFIIGIWIFFASVAKIGKRVL